MKNCKDCKHADWKKTKAGRLHPSGDGQCRIIYKIMPLPQSMYWVGGEPSPYGGHINRKENFKDHCIYYEQA